jgi:hypothetical protein
LVDVFEGTVTVQKVFISDKATEVADVRRRKVAKKLSVWLQLKISTPYQVTHVLLDQVHAARELKLRFEA